MDRLISLEPSNQVAIRIEPGQKCSGSLTLRNVMHTMPVAFRLQPMNKARYLTRPQSGIITPLSTMTIEIVYLSAPNAILPYTFPESDDSFLLHSVVVPGATIKDPSSWSDNVPTDWFTTMKKQIFIDSAIKILFIGSPVLARLVADGLMDRLRVALENSDPSTAPADSTDAHGQTLLHIAIARCRADLVQLLLEFEPNIEARNRSGRTPLEAAAAAGENLIVELLLARKASTEPLAPSTWGPIHFAANRGHLEVIRLLLLKGADVDALASDGRTALHIAVEERHMGCARLLLASGASANVGNVDGETPLHLATGLGDGQMVKLLLQRGANKDIRSRLGKTAYDIAVECGHIRLFDQLRLGDNLCAAARKGEVRTICQLLENGASVKGRDQHGWTALHRAAFKGWLEAVKTLLEKGVDINASDNDGYTVLHCAAESGQAEVVELLVKKGAYVDARTKKGVKALQIADSLNYSGIVRILVQGGAARDQLAVAPPPGAALQVPIGGATAREREIVPAKKKISKVRTRRSNLDMPMPVIYST